MSDPNLLAEQIEACKRRLQDTVARMRGLLVEDIKGYPERELRRRFLLDAVRAESISDGELAALRREAGDLGASLAAEVAQALAPEARWLDDPVDLPRTTRDLRAVPAIWKLLDPVDDQLEAFAARYGLGGDDRDPAGYRPPARFIAGQHLPTLVETWARELETLRELQGSLQTQVAEKKQQSLSERWARAAADK